jgi:hypothetical protein
MVADADGPVDPTNPTKFLNDDLNEWEPEFKDEEIHGVILITGSSHPTIQGTLTKVKKIFKVDEIGASIREVTKVEGHVRPGDVHGHEQYAAASYTSCN